MNTPSHAIINVATLGTLSHQEMAVPILVGAVFPDLPMYWFYVWTKLVRRLPEWQIWSCAYYQPFWLNINHGFHSIPLFGLAMGICYLENWQAAGLFFGSALLHCLEDLPVHNDDAHRHFLPFSQYRFVSPISYWDFRKYGFWVSSVEKLLVLGATWMLWGWVGSGIGRGILLAVNFLYFTSHIYIVWKYPRLLRSQNWQL